MDQHEARHASSPPAPSAGRATAPLWPGLSGGPPTRGEWQLLALFLLALLGVWLLQYQPFLLPNNDYASFERVARSLAAFELPASFKRMPLFPALMALLAPLFEALGRPHPYLDAALAWNQAFSLASLVLAFLLARRAFGPAALLLPLLLGTNVQVHLMALQPLVEPSLVFFVLLAFVLNQRGSAWQYLAAGCVALSRYEAGVLIPALFVANVATGAPFLRHVALSAAACSGIGVWLVLSSLFGRDAGGGFYFDLMEGMGWQLAPGFLERSLKEPFRGWYVRSTRMLVLLGLLIGVPGLIGLWQGMLRFRRTTLAAVLAWILGVGVIVGFGIDKARYVAHTQWIPLFFWTAGLAWLLGVGAARLDRRGRALGWGAAAVAAALVVRAGARADLRLDGFPAAVAPGAEHALLWTAVVVAAAGLAGWPGRTTAGRVAAGWLVVAVATPVLGGGLLAKDKGLHKVYHANQSVGVLADWLAENLGEDRAVTLARTHIRHLVDIPAERLLAFPTFEVETPEELAAQMRARGARYAVYTFRRDPDDPSERFYYRLHNMRVVEWFESGGPVPGFRHVATLPLPPELERLPVQIYEVAPAGPAEPPPAGEPPAGGDEERGRPGAG